MKRASVKSAVLVVLLIGAVTGCATTAHQAVRPHHGTDVSSSGTSVGKPSKPSAGGVSLTVVGSSDWPMFGNNAWQDRYAPDSLLNQDSISRVHLAFNTVIPSAKGSNESFLQEENNTLYVTTSIGQVDAFNAMTGKLVWDYAVNPSTMRGLPHMNRGVAVGKNHVYVLTPNDQLIALQRVTGKVKYRVVVANPIQGYFESMAPLLADGRIIVGSAGGDEGVRGFVAAYDATSGKPLWRFYTIPARGHSWVSSTGDHGGGAVWTTPSYDAKSQTIFFGTGNPSPDYFGVARPGPDLYTDSVIAISAVSGKVRWYQQEIAHDLWDYDVASPPMEFPVHGKLVVGEAGKDGLWYEWNAKTGKSMISPVAFVKEGHKLPTQAGTLEWPGADGGANYGPSAFDPQTSMAYVAGINGPEVLYAAPEAHSGHTLDLGTAQNPGPKSEWTGTITAIHTDTGTIAWQISTPTPPIGGVSVTAGGVLWFGLADGTLDAVSATSGTMLWHTKTGAPIGSAPIIYESAGHTFVALVTGGAKSLSTLFPWQGSDRLIVYELR